jgi:hypothetical protein
MKATFKNEHVLTAFGSMGEGMWEVQNDTALSGDVEAIALANGINEVVERVWNNQEAQADGTIAVEFFPSHLDAFDSILANLRDQGDYGIDVEGEERGLLDDDVVIAPDKHFSEYVLLQAIELIERSGVAEHDQDAKNVIDALAGMVAQRGCECFDAGVTDGKLTTLMDIVIHG